MLWCPELLVLLFAANDIFLEYVSPDCWLLRSLFHSLHTHAYFLGSVLFARKASFFPCVFSVLVPFRILCHSLDIDETSLFIISFLVQIESILVLWKAFWFCKFVLLYIYVEFSHLCVRLLSACDSLMYGRKVLFPHFVSIRASKQTGCLPPPPLPLFSTDRPVFSRPGPFAFRPLGRLTPAPSCGECRRHLKI